MTQKTRKSPHKSRETPKATAADKAEFRDEVSAIISATRAGRLPRSERMQAIDALIAAYVDGTGERPDDVEIARLTDAILHEELTDRHPDKITRNEYPFMSDWQLDLRRDREYSVDLAENHGIDGKDYREPTRRRRTAKEERFVEKIAQMKNKRRKAQYRRDTTAGHVSTEISESFVMCRGLGDMWRDRLSLVY